MICDECKRAADAQDYIIRADVDPHIAYMPPEHCYKPGCPCMHNPVGDTRVIKKIDHHKSEA